ncbi:hypothetical protein P3X46_027107 [Hevea brasiliensis]|uniref:Uncharacterized protein n=1 Tax=Hevea brasiliensis TaxID=3981 RepID=A0ABQ9L0A1_HEVBR|nr:uncharacterized protein LOC110643130 [Hevea brasiliensis]KAJ9153689.1 hypothetical protein P3X46_027107 [Hevea brasiliensis]
MGGGAAMKAACKIAGIGVVNSGFRGGFSAVSSPAEQSVRNASRPVSAILSSCQTGATGGVEIAGVQRPALQIDDWEFAGGDEEQLLESNDPIPRVVFGPAPSLQEAKSATNELKDALEKVYTSSSPRPGSGGSLGGGQLSGLTLLTNSDYLENKSCITCEPRSNSASSYAIKAFALLNESPEAQSVVASIAADPNVWDAVMKNEALLEFLQSQKTKSDADDESQDLGSPREFTKLSDDASEAGKFENGYKYRFENIKHTVVEMMNNVSSFVHHIFGFSAAENISGAADGNSRSSFSDNTLRASFMALALMVIVMVVLRRG